MKLLTNSDAPFIEDYFRSREQAIPERRSYYWKMTSVLLNAHSIILKANGNGIAVPRVVQSCDNIIAPDAEGKIVACDLINWLNNYHIGKSPVLSNAELDEFEAMGGKIR